jgi:hypothetical protein
MGNECLQVGYQLLCVYACHAANIIAKFLHNGPDL